MLADSSMKGVLGRTSAVPASRLQPAASLRLPVPAGTARFAHPEFVWVLCVPLNPLDSTLHISVWCCKKKNLLTVFFEFAPSSFPWVFPGFGTVRYGTALLLIYLPAPHCSWVSTLCSISLSLSLFLFSLKRPCLIYKLPFQYCSMLLNTPVTFLWTFYIWRSSPECACTGVLWQACWDFVPEL